MYRNVPDHMMIPTSRVRSVAGRPLRTPSALVRPNRAHDASALSAKPRHQGSTSQNSGDDENIPLPPRIRTKKSDTSLEAFASWFQRDELNIHPDYQRGFVWDQQKSSRLILTILAGRLVPPVTLHQTPDGNYDVVDGKQRLTSIIAFLLGDSLGWKKAPVRLVFPGDDESTDELQRAYNGKSFAELPRRVQKEFRDYTLHCQTIEKDTDPEAVFQVYEDINSGGINCTPQQLRKCVFYGPYIQLLEELCQQEQFQQLLGQEKPDDEKESDRELILRFFAMKENMHKFGSKSLKAFLNQEVSVRRYLDEDERLASTKDKPKLRAEMSRDFKDTVDAVAQIFGRTNAFRKYNPKAGKWEAKFSPALYDAIMVGLCAAIKQHKKVQLIKCGDSIREGYMQLFDNPAWTDTLSYTKRVALQNRHRLFTNMVNEAVAGYAPRRPQPAGLKEELFSQQRGLCALCHNRIMALEDAEVDHIQPLALRGSDEKRNKQLVHRTCNRHKGARVSD